MNKDLQESDKAILLIPSHLRRLIHLMNVYITLQPSRPCPMKSDW